MKLIGKNKKWPKLALIVLTALTVATVFVNVPDARAAVRSCTASTPVAQRPALHYGDSGSCVRELQTRLRTHGQSIAVDGGFGPATQAAVKRFQSSARIAVDGNVGPITWSKLLGTTPPPPPPPPPATGGGFKLSSGISSTRSAITGCQNTTGYALLTYDDGILSSQIDTLLSTLKAKNVRAIFFFTGEYARSNPTVMKKIVAAGMLLGNHSSSHPSLPSLSDAGIRSQITNGVQGTTSPKLLRPPYGNGAFTTRLQTIARGMGYGLCYWTVDTMDWSASATRSASQLVNRVRYGDQYSARVRPGGVVLMHGTGRYSVAATPGVIDAMRANGANPLPLR